MNIVFVRNTSFAIFLIAPFMFNVCVQADIISPFMQSEHEKAEPRTVYRSLGENPDITSGSYNTLQVSF